MFNGLLEDLLSLAMPIRQFEIVTANQSIDVPRNYTHNPTTTFKLLSLAGVKRNQL